MASRKAVRDDDHRLVRCMSRQVSSHCGVDVAASTGPANDGQSVKPGDCQHRETARGYKEADQTRSKASRGAHGASDQHGTA
jgi:hypothetical protein